MIKIIGNGKSLLAAGAQALQKQEKVRIGKSGLPLEMPLDTFEKELDIINKLDPAAPFERSVYEIQNKLNYMQK